VLYSNGPRLVWPTSPLIHLPNDSDLHCTGPNLNHTNNITIYLEHDGSFSLVHSVFLSLFNKLYVLSLCMYLHTYIGIYMHKYCAIYLLLYTLNEERNTIVSKNNIYWAIYNNDNNH